MSYIALLLVVKYLVWLVKTPDSVERWLHVILVGIHRAFFGRGKFSFIFYLVRKSPSLICLGFFVKI